MLKLKLQYFGHLMQRTDSLEKTLILEKIKGRIRVQQKMRWLNDIANLNNMSLTNVQEMVKDREAWHAVVHGVTKCQPLLSDWTILNVIILDITQGNDFWIFSRIWKDVVQLYILLYICKTESP